MLRILVLLFLTAGIPSVALFAQTRFDDLNPERDPRGEAELVVCSQNLSNFGLYRFVKARKSSASEVSLKYQAEDIAKRIAVRKCDVVAVQEILGKEIEDAKAGLKLLTDLLRKVSGRFYDVRVGPSNDKYSRVGFLVARDRASINSTLSYYNVALPKISEKQEVRDFARGPLEIQLTVKPRGDSSSKNVTLITFHFKSKHNSRGDPANLEWETYRMEMAEALRRIIENRHSRSFATGQSLLVVLGDRNSNFDVASAKLLEGELILKHFQEEAPCRLSKRGVPLCKPNVASPQRLFSVLVDDPETKLLSGTFRYQDTYSWLDDILLAAPSLRFALSDYSREGDYDSGVMYAYPLASDHAMPWVKLNW